MYFPLGGGSLKGVSKPGEANFNGYVNFLAGNRAENGIEATAKTSQIFLLPVQPIPTQLVIRF